MIPYFIPPYLDLDPPSAIYMTARDQWTIQAKETISDSLSTDIFDRQLYLWRAEMQALVSQQQASLIMDLSPAAALKRVMQRTGWSQRDIGAAVDRSHTEIKRILDRERIPRDDVARMLADLDSATEVFARTVRDDPTTLRRLFTTAPFGGAETALSAVRAGNVARAMQLATRVLYPRVEGMLEIMDSDVGNGTVAYLDEG
jgi:hypothetical protein